MWYVAYSRRRKEGKPTAVTANISYIFSISLANWLLVIKKTVANFSAQTLEYFKGVSEELLNQLKPIIVTLCTNVHAFLKR